MADLSNIFAICSHGRAYEYFTESISNARSACSFKAVECKDYSSYTKGECNSCNINSMGFSSRKPFNGNQDNRYYISTNAEARFCRIDQLMSINKRIKQRDEKYCNSSSMNRFCFLTVTYIIFLNIIYSFILN